MTFAKTTSVGCGGTSTFTYVWSERPDSLGRALASHGPLRRLNTSRPMRNSNSALLNSVRLLRLLQRQCSAFRQRDSGRLAVERRAAGQGTRVCDVLQQALVVIGVPQINRQAP